MTIYNIYFFYMEDAEGYVRYGKIDQPHRHIDAMKERERKDFHYEFTTLRFSVISVFGEWSEGVKN